MITWHPSQNRPIKTAAQCSHKNQYPSQQKICIFLFNPTGSAHMLELCSTPVLSCSAVAVQHVWVGIISSYRHSPISTLTTLVDTNYALWNPWMLQVVDSPTFAKPSNCKL